MNNPSADLLALLAQARQIVPDDRHIWCTASDTFASRLTKRRGLLLGGAYSPHFLHDTSATSWEIPWAQRLRYCRVAVCAQAAQEPLAAWLPLMEKVAGAGESLLVVTDKIDSELLSTFVVNACKGTLRVGVAHPPRDCTGSPASGAQLAAPPLVPDSLLRLDEVWVRRTATACFPAASDSMSAAAALQDFAIIETGGENHDDQFDRLRFLMQELQRADRE